MPLPRLGAGAAPCIVLLRDDKEQLSITVRGNKSYHNIPLGLEVYQFSTKKHLLQDAEGKPCKRLPLPALSPNKEHVALPIQLRPHPKGAPFLAEFRLIEIPTGRELFRAHYLIAPSPRPHNAP